ncbi:hypothetical protein Taro_032664 [Colocasia esculenta]|uniref:Uncharacterized protein n=1 Tax=Colocasia esculenta TaxID=4460 RepID=A0A843W2I7_COLES|nr:hypothetical protein [Colocasia esculenta]
MESTQVHKYRQHGTTTHNPNSVKALGGRYQAAHADGKTLVWTKTLATDQPLLVGSQVSPLASYRSTTSLGLPSRRSVTRGWNTTTSRSLARLQSHASPPDAAPEPCKARQ